MEKRYKLKTAPTFDPVPLTEVKANLRILHTDQDDYLKSLLDTAVDYVQSETGRQLALAHYYLYLDEWPADDELEIEKGPVSEVTAVRYWAPDASDYSELASSNYQLDNSEQWSARLRFFDTPNLDADRMNGIQIEFTAGFSASGAIPPYARDAVVLFASERYLNPENIGINFGFGTRITAAERLLRKMRNQRF